MLNPYIINHLKINVNMVGVWYQNLEKYFKITEKNDTSMLALIIPHTINKTKCQLSFETDCTRDVLSLLCYSPLPSLIGC